MCDLLHLLSLGSFGAHVWADAEAEVCQHCYIADPLFETVSIASLSEEGVE